MFEKLLLAIIATFSLYLSAQDGQFNTTPTFSVVHRQVMPESNGNLWR